VSSGARDLADILSAAGVGPRRRRAKVRSIAPAPAVLKSHADQATCAHIFKRQSGRTRCQFCGMESPYAQGARRSRPGAGRTAPLEKDEQQAILHLLVAIGCRYDKTGLRTDIWVLGTRRRRGDHQGTMQTPGIGDVFAVLPPLRGALPNAWGFAPPVLWIEVKAQDGELSDAQENFRATVRGRCAYITGGLDAVRAYLTDRGYLKRQGA